MGYFGKLFSILLISASSIMLTGCGTVSDAAVITAMIIDPDLAKGMPHC